MKNCKKCGENIPEGRLKAIPGAETCVNCSGVQKKGTVTVMMGEGDHTWIETIHLEHEDYKRYIEAENKLKKMGKNLLDSVEQHQDLPYGFSKLKQNKKTDE
jgi:hypothetical protein